LVVLGATTFALIVTAVWAVKTTVAEEPSATAIAIADTLNAVNLGGGLVTLMIQIAAMLALIATGTAEITALGALYWPWILGAVFAGALVQGLFYALVVDAVRGVRRRRGDEPKW
jgi:uncharacterized integral membrane protein